MGSWLDEIRARVGTLPLGSYMRNDAEQLLAYIDKLHKAAVILGSKDCPDRGKTCAKDPGCEKCVMKCLDEMMEVVECRG